MFSQLIEAAPDAMVIVDGCGQIVLINRQAEQLFGYPREELFGRPVEVLIPAKARAIHIRHREDFSRAPSTRPMGAGLELSAVRKDGSALAVEVSLSPLETDEGRLVVSTIRDMTERKAVEQRLRESAARMAEAEKIARFGNWEWDPATDEIVWSDALYEIYGLTPETFSPTLAGYLERIHPEDREVVARTITDSLSGKKPFMLEERVVRPDGETRVLRSQGRPMCDEQGAVLRMLGVCQDVTELRAAERARRQAEARFRSAFENAPIGVALIALEADGAGRFLDVNRSLCRITGHRREQLLELRPDDLTDSRDLAAERALRKQLVAGSMHTYSTEQRCVRATGETIWTLVNVSLVPEANGSPGYAIEQVQDITDRKHSESRLQFLADHDPLTGLANRRRLLQELDSQLAYHARYGGQGALLLLDLDGFKKVNDTFGHAVGDHLIKKVGTLLRERLRETDVVGRLGGDEFAVLLPHADDVHARAVAMKLLQRVRGGSTVTSNGRRIQVSASIGVALFGGGFDLTSGMVLANADVAMYQAKAAGRNRVTLFEASNEPEAQPGGPDGGSQTAGHSQWDLSEPDVSAAVSN